MCGFLPLYHQPTGCVTHPRHIVQVKVYVACLQILNDPDQTKERCEDKDCQLLGSFGATRTRAECSHCLAFGPTEPLCIVFRDPAYAALLRDCDELCV